MDILLYPPCPVCRTARAGVGLRAEEIPPVIQRAIAQPYLPSAAMTQPITLLSHENR